jgi:hypothetical protein
MTNEEMKKNKRIIYPKGNGIVVLSVGDLYTFEQVCNKDVPAGVPYRIVDISDFPEDREFRNAWEMDFSNPDGYGADYGVGTNKVVTGYDENEIPKLIIVLGYDEDGKQIVEVSDDKN